MKKVIFNPYAKTKTTTSNDCDEYDYTVVSEIEDMAIQEYVLMVSANTFADTMNHDDAGSFNLYYPETLYDEELFNDQWEEEQRSFEEELYRLGLQEVELPETTLTATQLNRNESKRCALRRFLSNKTSYVITSYWSVRIGLWLQQLGRRQFSRRFCLQWIADTLSQAVTHFNAHIDELNVELSETTKQLEEEKQQHQISKNSLKETQKERELLKERVTLLETSTRVGKGEIQELTDTNKNLKGQFQGIQDELDEEKQQHQISKNSLKETQGQFHGIQDELLEERRMHNETEDLLKATEGRLDLYVTDFSNEFLPNFESLVAAKGVVVAENGEVIKQFNAFKEEHDNVNQELIGIKKLAKDGNLIGYENKYDGQRYDEAHLASFTDDVVAKFCDYKFDDEPAPHPFPISQNPGTEAEMVDIICKEREYIDKICITPALYISFLNYAIRKFDKPYIKYGKFMLFVKDYAFNFPRYVNAKKFYESQRDANQQTGAAAAGVVVPTEVNQSTSALIPPSPALKSKKAIKPSNPSKRKQLPLPTRTVIESKIIY